MKIAVVGPGAMGLLLAARLQRAGAEVRLLDYRPERAAHIQGQGVILEHESGSHTQAIPAKAEPTLLGEVELAIVCTKAYHTPEVARILGLHLAPEARALTLQNGAGNVEAMVAALGAGRVLGGITSEGATLLAIGRVRHAGQGQTHIGPAQGPVDGFTRRVLGLLQAAGFEASASEGVQNLIWTKLVVNVGINALTALLGVRNGRLLELPPAREIVAQAVGEALTVGRARGVDFLHEDMLAAVEEVARRTGANVSSMLQDVRAKRHTEVAYINGAVVRSGAELGIPTPVNATLAKLVQALEADYLAG
ncbi:MAG: 2-dehydropantoate 2-reductase [Desulfarculus sp.]|nr:MAG: 2-dehydropantoate 2-reductase [Desulfarculus sp.]